MDQVAAAPSSSSQDIAGPWPRFFARLVDSVFWALTIVAIVVLSPISRLPLFRQMDHIFGGQWLGYAALPIVAVINAVVITIFGRSLGKWVLDLRVVSEDGARSLGFRDNVIRELLVLLLGNGLGFAPAGLFLNWRAFRDLRKGNPTVYDAMRKTAVVALSHSRLRQGIGVAVGVIAFIAVCYGAFMAGMHDAALKDPTPWTNSVTSIATIIPAGWEVRDPATVGGTKQYWFFNPKTGIGVALFSLSVPAATSIRELTADTTAASQAGKGGLSLGDWSAEGDPSIFKASGVTAPPAHTIGSPVTLILTKAAALWEIVYTDTIDKTPRDLDDPALTKALVSSLGALSGPDEKIADKSLPSNHLNAFIAQVKKCWKATPDQIASRASADMLSDLKPDGSISDVNVTQGDDSDAGLAISLQLAIQQCSPYDLPKDAYASWKQLDIKFFAN